MMIRLLCALLIAGTVIVSPVWSQDTILFRGKVVSLDGRLAPGFRLRIVGRGEPDLLDSGEFTFALPRDLTELSVESLHDRLDIIYPPQGRVNVPADRERITIIVVGAPAEQAVADALADRTRLLEQRLAEEGVQFNVLHGTLEAGIQRILEKLDLQEEELRDAVKRKDQRAHHFPAIASALKEYVRRAKDLRNAFELIGPVGDESAAAYRGLQRWMLAYQEAYDTLDNNQASFELQVRTYWDDPELLDDLKRWYDLALGEIHRDRILASNQSLVDLQLAINDAHFDKARVRTAKEYLARIAAELQPRLQRLDLETTRFLEALARF